VKSLSEKCRLHTCWLRSLLAASASQGIPTAGRLCIAGHTNCWPPLHRRAYQLFQPTAEPCVQMEPKNLPLKLLLYCIYFIFR
jgi:hypothetical protein